MTIREQILKQAQAWLGRKESDGTHMMIIDYYNSHKPLARGYKVKYTDEWCATFVSAVAIKCGATDIIPTECSCEKMIALLKQKGSWVENDAYLPSPGDIIFYDWEDSGAGDATGSANHVGIVEKVVDNVITVIEGNINSSVGRRNIKVNGRYIRGYGVPKYKEVKPMAKLDNTPASWAKEAVDWAVKEGILKGDENGDYKLHENITVERFLVFLYRAMN